MNTYACLRPLLFCFDPEVVHSITLKTLATCPFLAPSFQGGKAVEVMGLTFGNRLGLAAGVDKNGVAIAAFARMGFAFIEVGTVTPKAQPGNKKPRVFRLPEANAIINRMGFNNDGISAVCARMKQVKETIDTLIGINLGKNKTTANAHAVDDYVFAMQTAYPLADYLTINISSPNTQGLRNLQHGSALQRLLEALKQKQNQLFLEHGRYVPLVIKIAPDNTSNELNEMLTVIDGSGIDGIIASNTTIDKTTVQQCKHGAREGGLSGTPLMEKSTRIVNHIRARLPDIALIASGGVMSADDYHAKLAAGADLVQLYSGLIYRGPALIRECLTPTP